jgi:methionyl aminopeptidase
MKLFLKTEDEIKLIHQAGQLVGSTLGELAKHIKPGVTTLQLDNVAEDFIRSHNAESAFKGSLSPFGEPFPASICTSVNHVVSYGIPCEKDVLEEGDIISVECGVVVGGFRSVGAYTFGVGNVKPSVRTFLNVSKEAFRIGIGKAVAGNHVGDIGFGIRQHTMAGEYRAMGEQCGHGIGRCLNEDPLIPLNGKRGRGLMLEDGMCLTISPTFAMGTSHVKLQSDKWTVFTAENRITAHFEHTVAVRRGKVEILSSFDEIERTEEDYN